MGNCCGTTSSSSSAHYYWGGEDWSFLMTSNNNNNNNRKQTSPTNTVFDESKLTNNKDDSKLHDLVGDFSASSSRNGKIKIKMSEKELQVLLGELEKKKKNSAEQVLVRLIETRHHGTGQSNWSPVLEGVPEANSSSD